MPTSTEPLSSGSGQSGARGLGGTGAVLSKKGERTWRTAALLSRFEMSVTEARFWC